jgi:hypothetical protein
MALTPISTAGGSGFGKYPTGDNSALATGTTAILKEFYLPAVRDQLNRQTILKRYIRRNTEEIAGRYGVMALRTGGNEGIGSIAEGGLLPTPGSQQYDQARYRIRYQSARLLITAQSIMSSRNDRGAFTRALDAEIRGLTQDRMHEDNRILFGNGSGVLATVVGVSGSTITVANPGGFTNNGPGTQYLRENMKVGFADDGTAAFRASDVRTITAVNHAAGTITVSSNTANVVAGDLMFRTSNDLGGTATLKDSSLCNEPYGLAAIVDNQNIAQYPTPYVSTGNLLGDIDASTTNIWNSVVINDTGIAKPFSQDFLQQGEDAVNQVSGSQVDFYITTFGIRRQYLNSLVASKRFPNTMKLDGGWTALEYNTKPLVVDKDCTRGRLYGLSLDSIQMFVEAEYQWDDADGSVLHRLPDYHAYQAHLFSAWSTGTDARNRHFVVKDILD